jgi:hypothetical protein
MSNLYSQPTSASKVIIETKIDLFSIIDFSAERHFGTRPRGLAEANGEKGQKGTGEKSHFGPTK